MRANAQSTDLRSTGVEAVEAFSLSEEDTAHIMSILRDSIYSDPILAVLREYSSNAWDAHRQTPGCKDRPIKVVLPTVARPTLTIRDFGMGLSKHDVLRVYTKYGKSTKRDSDQAVGFLGIGCKAGFAYATQFTVTSWHGGYKRIFVASLNETGVGVMQMMHEEPCDPDETGVEVKIACKQEDIWTFHNRARKLFRHFDPLPDINLHLEQPNRLRLGKGYLVPEGDGEWVALMGCVPYRVDLNKLVGHAASAAITNLPKIGGGLYFGIGEVQFASSREELNYTDKTKDAILRRLEELLEEYTTRALDDVRNGTSSWFDRRLQIRFLRHVLKYNVPKEFRELAVDHVTLRGKGIRVYDPFRESFGSSIQVSGRSTIYLRDDQRKLKGYQLTSHDHIIDREDPGTETFEAFEARVKALLEEEKLTGIPLRRLSSAPWSEERSNRGVSNRTSNPKHKVTSFELKGDQVHFDHPYSQCWTIVDRVPEDSDVFVRICGFTAEGYGPSGFFSMFRTDRDLIEALGGKMPPIYGYKTTVKKPVQDSDCTGTPYLEWRGPYLESLLTRKVKILVTEYHWSKASEVPWRARWSHGDNWRSKIAEKLPKDHVIARYLLRQVQAEQVVAKADKKIRAVLPDISKMLRETYKRGPKKGRNKPLPHQEMFAHLKERYPLLMANDPWDALTDEAMGRLWLDYIALVDRDRARRGAQG